MIVLQRQYDLSGSSVCILDPTGEIVAYADVFNRSYRIVNEKGLSFRILTHAFEELRCRGAKNVDLNVDLESPTGAGKLYARSGMRVVETYFVYRKQIRPEFGPGETR